MQGELLLQDSFLVWEPKSLIRKGRDRHLFLFELSLIFSKEIKDSSGRTKYLYKSRLRVAEIQIISRKMRVHAEHLRSTLQRKHIRLCGFQSQS